LELNLGEWVDRSPWWYFAILKVDLAVVGAVFGESVSGFFAKNAEVLPKLVRYQL
jgi:hypothetical protein